MSERWDDFLQGFGKDDEEDASDEGEEAFVRKLAADPFAFMDDLAAERRGISADELRRRYFRGRRPGR
jgi:hypothetical protein